jgi:hypothetical protein
MKVKFLKAKNFASDKKAFKIFLLQKISRSFLKMFKEQKKIF